MNLEQAREELIQHSHSKRNGFFPLIYTHAHKIMNPLCGDQVDIKMNVQDQRILEIGFMAKACAICTASTSMMCETLLGKSIEEALDFAKHFENEVLANADSPWPTNLSSLKSFEHLKIHHARRACALLPWVALRSAVKEKKI